MPPIVARSSTVPFAPSNSPNDGDILTWDSTSNTYIWQASSQATVNGTAAVNEVPSGAMDGTNTVFVLSNTPISGTVMLFWNGQLQKPGVGNDYTIVGDTITMSDPPPGRCPTDVLLAWYLQEGQEQPVWTPVIKIADYSSKVWDEIYCDTTAIASFTVDMPLNPVLGDTVRIVNMTNSFAYNHLFIGRNGQRIMGLEQNLTVDINRSFALKFSDSSYGWVIY